MEINNLSADAFLKFANNTAIDETDGFTQENITKLTQDGEAKEHAISLSQGGSKSVRNELLGVVKQALGGKNDEVLGAIREKLFGSREEGVETAEAQKQLSKRDISMVMKLASETSLNKKIDDEFSRFASSMMLKVYDESDDVSLDAGGDAVKAIDTQIRKLKELVNKKLDLGTSGNALSMSDVSKIVKQVRTLADDLRGKTANEFFAMNDEALSKLVDEKITKLASEEHPAVEQQPEVKEGNNVPNEVKEGDVNQQPEVKEDNVGQEEEIVKNHKPQHEQSAGVNGDPGTVGVKSSNLIEGAEEIGLNTVEVNNNPEVAEKKDAQMAFLKHLARYAGGEEGGRGFVGVDEFGSTVKFLTKWHEGFDVDALTDGDKKCLNDATDRLRKQIVDFANGLDEDLKNAVLSELPPEEPTNKGLKNFIKRETIARIVNLVADGLTDSKGNKFDWKGIKPAVTLSSTTLDKVFDFDFRHNLEKLSAGDKKSLKIKNSSRLNGYDPNSESWVTIRNSTKVFSSQMLHCLEDSDVQKKLADEEFVVSEGRNINTTSKKMTSYKAEHAIGSTAKAMAELLERYPGKKISAMGYGDNTYCACYWKFQGSQEEAFFRMLDPKTPAKFKAHGKVKQTTHRNKQDKDVLKYQGDVRSRLSPAMGGIHIETSLVAVDEKPLPEAKPIGMVIGAAPCLDMSPINKDEIGQLDHMVMFRKDILQDEETIQMWNDLDPQNKIANPEVFKAAEKKQANALNFCDKFYETAKESEELFPDGVGNNLFRPVMQMELYYKFDDVDVYADDTDVQIKKLMGHLVELKKDPEAWEAATKIARDNYAKSMVEMFRRIIRLENDKGTEVLLVGKMGCGAFNNLSEDMLTFLAEACVLEAGDMQIVYSQYKDNKEGNADRESFEQKMRFFAEKHGVKIQ